jgi:hypothetical protein
VVIIITTTMDPSIITCIGFCQHPSIHPSNPSPGILALVH